jgi:hypothetical protein
MRRISGRYKHYYNGGSNSRGKRFLSKIHKGIDFGNVEKAFKEVEELNESKNTHKVS